MKVVRYPDVFMEEHLHPYWQDIIQILVTIKK
jgi:hypothetical protein